MARKKAKRALVGREDERTLADRIWPQRHRRWWNRDVQAGKAKSNEELYIQLFGERLQDDVAAEVQDEHLVRAAEETLEHVEEIGTTAVDRAAAADRRATTIAGTVAIAASFTIAGGALVADPSKIDDHFIRTATAATLMATTLAFALAAVYALRALVATRDWTWSDPHDLPASRNDSRVERIRMRAVHSLDNFAGNWEISDQKNRNVDNALRCLVAALAGIVVVAALILIYVL